ncbi:MAG: hypothetical protein ACOYLV_02655 [Rubrivivax sp.]
MSLSHPVALFPALFFTVALLVTTAYFLLGGLPLLVLQHDTPTDARFVRGFFNVYYRAALATSAGAAASYALSSWYLFALGAGVMALAVLALRRRFIPAMEQIGAAIHSGERGAIGRFRRLHSAALLLNLLQLLVLVWSLMRLPL